MGMERIREGFPERAWTMSSVSGSKFAIISYLIWTADDDLRHMPARSFSRFSSRRQASKFYIFLAADAL